jgi:hypothetical protein
MKKMSVTDAFSVFAGPFLFGGIGAVFALLALRHGATIETSAFVIVPPATGVLGFLSWQSSMPSRKVPDQTEKTNAVTGTEQTLSAAA